MEFKKETLEEFESTLKGAYEAAKEEFKNVNEFEGEKELKMMGSYLATLEEKLKTTIEERNNWKDKAINLQSKK
jgi:hypothetical protein